MELSPEILRSILNKANRGDVVDADDRHGEITTWDNHRAYLTCSL